MTMSGEGTQRHVIDCADRAGDQTDDGVDDGGGIDSGDELAAGPSRCGLPARPHRRGSAGAS